MIQPMSEQTMPSEDPKNAFGIIIHDVREEPRPAVSAFIWGGKVRPTPELPYGKHA